MAESAESGSIATTALFVELLVIGGGAVTGGVLVAISIAGTSWLRVVEAGGGMLLAAVTVFTYVAGIVIDRVADSIFGRVSAKMRSEAYPNHDEFVAARIAVLREASLPQRLAYGRSRLRICRGWVLNSAFIGIGIICISFNTPDNVSTSKVLSFGLASAVLLGAGCGFAWFRLATVELSQLKHQAAALSHLAANS